MSQSCPFHALWVERTPNDYRLVSKGLLAVSHMVPYHNNYVEFIQYNSCLKVFFVIILGLNPVEVQITWIARWKKNLLSVIFSPLPQHKTKKETC